MLLRSSLAGGHASHKTIKDEPALLRFYYTAPYALFWVCTFNELFLLSAYLLTHLPELQAIVCVATRGDVGCVDANRSALVCTKARIYNDSDPCPHMPSHPSRSSPSGVLPLVGAFFAGPVHVVEFIAYVSFPVFALKQVFSVIQLLTAAKRIVAMDEADRAHRSS